MPAAPHAVGEEEQHSWEAERAGSSRHIAYANEPSTCGEALALLHPPTGWLREEEGCAPQTQNEVRDGAPDFPDEHGCLWLLVPGIVPAIHSTDNLSGRRRRRPVASRHFLDALRLATGLLLRGNGASHLLAGKRPQLRTVWPTATGRTLAVRFPPLRKEKGLLWRQPTRSRVSCRFASLAQALAADSTPTDRQCARVLVGEPCRH
jgi:hypothetical protein